MYPFKYFLISLLVISGNARATDGIVCTGKIETLSIHSTDKLLLKLTGMSGVVQICNLSATLGNTYPVSAQQCKAVYAALLLAFSQDKTMTLHFDNVVTGTSCSTFVNWEVATVRYVPLVR